MARIDAGDVRLELPLGWDAKASRFELPEERLAPASLARGGLLRLHASSRPLDGAIGDYGSGLVEVLGSRDVFMALLEHEESALTSPLFDNPIPRSITARDFDPQALQRTLAGQSGLQRFFTHRSRPFCLYVVLGAHLHRHRVTPVINEVLRSLEIL